MCQVKIYQDHNKEVSVGTMSASQSSLHGNNEYYAASTCLNGRISASCHTGGTDTEKVRPWWEVDLGTETSVYKVRIHQCWYSIDGETNRMSNLDIQLISKDDVVLATADTKIGLENPHDCKMRKNSNSEACVIEFTTDDSESGFSRNKCMNKCQSNMEAVLREETNKWKDTQPTVVGQCNKVSCEYMY